MQFNILYLYTDAHRLVRNGNQMKNTINNDKYFSLTLSIQDRLIHNMVKDATMALNFSPGHQKNCHLHSDFDTIASKLIN